MACGVGSCGFEERSNGGIEPLLSIFSSLANT